MAGPPRRPRASPDSKAVPPPSPTSTRRASSDSLRADSIRNWDTKILRSFPLRERLCLVVALDMLNMTNHTQFTAPNTSVTSSSFGTLSGQANWPRILQFNARVVF